MGPVIDLGRLIVVAVQHDPLTMRTRVWYANGATKFDHMPSIEKSDEGWCAWLR